MLRRLAMMGLVAALLGAAAILLLRPDLPERQLAGLTGDAKHGAYLARLGGCFGCHTDAKGGGKVLAGGAGIETPFGTFYGPNITMHEGDGIGAWTFEEFARAVAEGVSPEGNRYFPVFPYAHYSRLSDQDLADLWAAFQTVPPVAGKGPANDVGFPFNQRILMGPWNAMFAEFGPLDRDSSRSDSWSRGRFLAEGPGHCGACHTPRNLFGGLRHSAAFVGGTGPDSEEVPAITRNALLAAGYDKDELALALKTGLTPEGDSLGGSMGEVVSGSTRFWSGDDLRAIAAYLLE